MRYVLGIILLTGLLTVVDVRGEEVLVNFIAEVEYVDDTFCQCVPPGAILPGDTLKGSYVYNSTTVDSDPSQYEGAYYHDSSPYGVFIYHPDYFFGTDTSDVQFWIYTDDSLATAGPLHDRLAADSRNNSPDPFYVGNIDLILVDFYDPTATALGSDSLPTTAPTLSDWSSATIDIHGGGGFNYLIHANLTWVGSGQPPTHVGPMPSPIIVLLQNVPNPFNPTTDIEYSTGYSGHVTLTVCDVSGRRVRTLVDAFREAGRRYTVRWDGRNDEGHSVASGVYFYTLMSPRGAQTRKMLLLK